MIELDPHTPPTTSPPSSSTATLRSSPSTRGASWSRCADETELSRERLLETLRAWVDHPGRPTEVARAVHVHPQTARYRLRRLRELFGDIDDPERRFALALALQRPDERSRPARPI